MSNSIFKHNDGGKSKSQRPQQKNDCVVRAIAISCQIDYDDAFDFFKSKDRENNRGVCAKVWKPLLIKGVFDTKFEYISFPAQKGQSRMNIDSFCRFEHIRNIYSSHDTSLVGCY